MGVFDLEVYLGVFVTMTLAFAGALWKVNSTAQAVMDGLNKNYHTKTEVKEYIELFHKPILAHLKHMEGDIAAIKSMLEPLTNKK